MWRYLTYFSKGIWYEKEAVSDSCVCICSLNFRWDHRFLFFSWGKGKAGGQQEKQEYPEGPRHQKRCCCSNAPYKAFKIMLDPRPTFDLQLSQLLMFCPPATISLLRSTSSLLFAFVSRSLLLLLPSENQFCKQQLAKQNCHVVSQKNVEVERRCSNTIPKR